MRARAFKRDWLHHAATARCSVSRLNIHMLAPEAFRAVVRVAGSFDESAAMLALKIFYPLDKAHGDETSVIGVITQSALKEALLFEKEA